MPSMENTTLCYLERGEEYLLLHRTKKKNDINRDKWTGVGGHFEEGESPEDCMKREVWEETGLMVTSYCYRGIVTFVSDGYSEYMHLFTANAWTGNVQVCNEGDLQWMNKKEFAKLPMWEGDKIFRETAVQGFTDLDVDIRQIELRMFGGHDAEEAFLVGGTDRFAGIDAR